MKSKTAHVLRKCGAAMALLVSLSLLTPAMAGPLKLGRAVPPPPPGNVQPNTLPAPYWVLFPDGEPGLVWCIAIPYNCVPLEEG